MAELELIEDQGWILTLKNTEKDAIFCLYCGKKVEISGFWCKKHQKMLHEECNKGDWKLICEPTGKEQHEHFNIINIKWS